MLLEVLDEHLILPDEEDLRHRFVLEIAQRHAVLFEELDQIFAGNAAILTPRDAVALEATRIEPLAHSPRRYLADFGDLACRENLHHVNSMCTFFCVRNVSGQPAPQERGTQPPRRGTITVGTTASSSPSMAGHESAGGLKERVPLFGAPLKGEP